ncbi:MAG: hypothetical protein J3K34DRAFT_419653 [Monoraphidium minutum]|nr:MAG: hypothetical protein J3K34DRAFT_419653 [Monoraphidium minutum]
MLQRLVKVTQRRRRADGEGEGWVKGPGQRLNMLQLIPGLFKSAGWLFGRMCLCAALSSLPGLGASSRGGRGGGSAAGRAAVAAVMPNGAPWARGHAVRPFISSGRPSRCRRRGGWDRFCRVWHQVWIEGQRKHGCVGRGGGQAPGGSRKGVGGPGPVGRAAL